MLRQLVKEVSMILGGSIAIGSIIGGAVGAAAFGASKGKSFEQIIESATRAGGGDIF
ncbi:hypothetical protein [Pseudomonas serbica]